MSFYLIAQMVGAGNLVHLMFGLPYELAVVVVGGVMLLYVLFGGMIATTWVQIIKAGLLLFGVRVGDLPILNGLLIAEAVPALIFAVLAWLVPHRPRSAARKRCCSITRP